MADPDRCTRRHVLRAAGAATALGIGGTGVGTAQNETDGSSDAGQNGEADGDALDSPYTETYRNTIDSVVLVTVAPTGIGRGGGGLGSGFVIDEQHIVTNNHVVQGASEGGIEIQFNNQEWRTASVVGADAYSDLAVLRVEDMPDIAAGLSLVDSEPAIGQEVLAIGNPLGLNASVSQGIVSGVDRVLPSPAGTSIPATIQTDAPINPGNSGGPLVNLEGEVIGVVFAGADQTIGFAISARLANRVVSALLEDGSYEHPYMGVGVIPVGPDIADAIGLEEAIGVLVGEVVPNAPADGVLQPAQRGQPSSGDVIVAVDGQAVTTQAQLQSYLALQTSPGDTIELEVVRDGERQTVELTLASRQEFERPQPPIGGEPGPRPPIRP
ncbi:S1C family serine protease [Natrinema salsiterrestre]|uniref:Trypsin-like peptidase domain-containing protein n=1 Tax=Natrinema salsiterrestre TaxID=2950540 RepID=A0A9Q4L2C9_9EURY|nr:trypsin-like peptidase domain-containing protein [Natrinema salsiterrestre]MDF9746901.1 trypsin-like peptidase domain-containing protein [Natrinema salsiterrestre]